MMLPGRRRRLALGECLRGIGVVRATGIEPPCRAGVGLCFERCGDIHGQRRAERIEDLVTGVNTLARWRALIGESKRHGRVGAGETRAGQRQRVVRAGIADDAQIAERICRIGRILDERRSRRCAAGGHARIDPEPLIVKVLKVLNGRGCVNGKRQRRQVASAFCPIHGQDIADRKRGCTGRILQVGQQAARRHGSGAPPPTSVNESVLTRSLAPLATTPSAFRFPWNDALVVDFALVSDPMGMLTF